MNTPPESDQPRDAQLRTGAEAQLCGLTPAAAPDRTAAELLHELQMHQVELEMQNEALRLAQTALEESRDRFADFYEFAPVGYLTLSDMGLIVGINLTGAAMLGVVRAKLMQRRFSRFIRSEDADRWYSHLLNALNHDDKFDCELALQREDGSRIDVQLDSLRLIKDGLAPTLRVVMIDITTRKRRERDLQDSRRRLARAEFIAQVGHWSYEVADHTVKWSDELWKIYGRTPHSVELTYDTFTSWIREDFRAFHHNMLSRMLALKPGETIKDFIYCLVRPDGEERWAEVFLETEFDVRNTPQRFFGVVQDITERRQAELQLRGMARALELKVSERTSELRKLSARLAQTEERERRMLAQELHDDLIQILFAAKIKLSHLAENSPTPAVNQIVSLIDQAERAARLTMHRLSPLALQVLGLVPALEWLTEEMHRTHGLVTYFDSEGEPAPLSDEMQALVFRSVRELLLNVVKHAGADDTSLSCHYADGELTLIVSDNGCGFDLAGTTADSLMGLHFGLKAVHERMLTIGGNMEIDSSPGNGTTITLTMPCSAVTVEFPPS